MGILQNIAKTATSAYSSVKNVIAPPKPIPASTTAKTTTPTPTVYSGAKVINPFTSPTTTTSTKVSTPTPTPTKVSTPTTRSGGSSSSSGGTYNAVTGIYTDSGGAGYSMPTAPTTATLVGGSGSSTYLGGGGGSALPGGYYGDVNHPILPTTPLVDTAAQQRAQQDAYNKSIQDAQRNLSHARGEYNTQSSQSQAQIQAQRQQLTDYRQSIKAYEARVQQAKQDRAERNIERSFVKSNIVGLPSGDTRNVTHFQVMTPQERAMAQLTGAWALIKGIPKTIREFPTKSPAETAKGAISSVAYLFPHQEQVRQGGFEEKIASGQMGKEALMTAPFLYLGVKGMKAPTPKFETANIQVMPKGKTQYPISKSQGIIISKSVPKYEAVGSGKVTYKYNLRPDSIKQTSFGSTYGVSPSGKGFIVLEKPQMNIIKQGRAYSSVGGGRAEIYSNAGKMTQTRFLSSAKSVQFPKGQSFTYGTSKPIGEFSTKSGFSAGISTKLGNGLYKYSGIATTGGKIGYPVSANIKVVSPLYAEDIIFSNKFNLKNPKAPSEAKIITEPKAEIIEPKMSKAEYNRILKKEIAQAEHFQSVKEKAAIEIAGQQYSGIQSQMMGYNPYISLGIPSPFQKFDLKLGTIGLVKPFNVSDTRTIQAPIVTTDTRTIQITEPVIDTGQRHGQRQTQPQLQEPIQFQVPIQVPIQQPIQRHYQPQPQKPKNEFFQPQPIKTIIPIPKPLFQPEKKQYQAHQPSQPKPRGFDIMLGSGKNKIALGVSYPFKTAQAIARRKLLQNLKATAELFPSKKPIKNIRLRSSPQNERLFRSYRIKKGTRQYNPLLLIQRSSYGSGRLTSQAERSEIQSYRRARKAKKKKFAIW